MGKTCAICGKNSGMFPLCISCFKLKDTGEIEKCEKCGTWHYTNESCQCKTPEKDSFKTAENKRHEEQEPDEYEHSKNECIICQEPSENHYFCKSCYYKYRNKSLLIRITKCKNIELLDDSYEGAYKCKDGHIVKSKSERDIDNYFFDHDIAHAYEKPLHIDEETLHPDFYLPKLNIYLEHWGYGKSNKEYQEMKNYKIPLYKNAGITLICTYESSDAKDIESALDKKLSTYKKGQINFLEKEDICPAK